jgi:hypothetical protein
MNTTNEKMNEDTQDNDKPQTETEPRPKPRQHVRARSLAGIHGIAERPEHHPAVLAVAPTTSDIRKARQLAARRRALIACIACKSVRYLFFLQ